MRELTERKIKSGASLGGEMLKLAREVTAASGFAEIEKDFLPKFKRLMSPYGFKKWRVDTYSTVDEEITTIDNDKEGAPLMIAFSVVIKNGRVRGGAEIYVRKNSRTIWVDEQALERGLKATEKEIKRLLAAPKRGKGRPTLKSIVASVLPMLEKVALKHGFESREVTQKSNYGTYGGDTAYFNIVTKETDDGRGEAHVYVEARIQPDHTIEFSYLLMREKGRDLKKKAKSAEKIVSLLDRDMAKAGYKEFISRLRAS